METLLLLSMLEIHIPMPALSMNNSHMVLRRGGRIKTSETRYYENEFSIHLMKYSKEISEFLKEFDPSESSLVVDYEFYFNSEKYYTKKGRLNLSKLPDTDNLIKITQDLVFKNFTNDAHIVELSARKLPTRDDCYIKVSVDTCDLPQLA